MIHLFRVHPGQDDIHAQREQQRQGSFANEAGEPRLIYAFIPHKIETLISFSSVGEQGFYYRHIGNHSAGISESGNYCFLRIPQTRLYIKPGCSAHISSPSLNDALGLHYLSLPSASHPAKCDSLAWRLHT